MEYQTLREFLGHIREDVVYTFTAKHPRFGSTQYRCINTRDFIRKYPEDEEILDMYEVVKEKHTGNGWEYITPFTLELRLTKEYRPKIPRKTKAQREREKWEFEYRVKGDPWLEKLLSGKVIVNKGYDLEQTLGEALKNFRLHKIINANGSEADYDTVRQNLDQWNSKVGKICIRKNEGNCFMITK